MNHHAMLVLSFRRVGIMPWLPGHWAQRPWKVRGMVLYAALRELAVQQHLRDHHPTRRGYLLRPKFLRCSKPARDFSLTEFFQIRWVRVLGLPTGGLNWLGSSELLEATTVCRVGKS